MRQSEAACELCQSVTGKCGACLPDLQPCARRPSPKSESKAPRGLSVSAATDQRRSHKVGGAELLMSGIQEVLQDCAELQCLTWPPSQAGVYPSVCGNLRARDATYVIQRGVKLQVMAQVELRVDLELMVRATTLFFPGGREIQAGGVRAQVKLGQRVAAAQVPVARRLEVGGKLNSVRLSAVFAERIEGYDQMLRRRI